MQNKKNARSSSKKKNVPQSEETIGSTIQLDKATHQKVLLKQINKYNKELTVAEVCALAVKAGIDSL